MAMLAAGCGVDGFLVGSLIDGLWHERGFHIGPWAYGMAGVGALAGGWLGATSVEPGAPTEGWLAGPVVGAAAGLAVAAVPTIVLSMNGRDRAARQFFGWSMVGGISLGLLYGLLVTPDEEPPGAAASRPTTLLLSLPVRF